MAVQWSDWARLGKPLGSDVGSPFVQRNEDGRLEVFALGLDGIFNICQVAANGAWREGWLSKGRPAPTLRVLSHLVGRNADGRQEIFVVADNGTLWQKWQLAPNNGWSEWKTLGAPSTVRLTDRFRAGGNLDGRQEIFAIGDDGNIWQIWQTAPNGGWSDWKRLGRPTTGIRPRDRMTAATNQDGRQELFVMGGDDALWHIWQVGPNVGWSDWDSLGKPRDSSFAEPRERDLTDPRVQRNADGHLEVFAPGNGAFCNRWQEAPGSNTWRRQGWNEKPRPQPSVGIVSLDAALNVGGQLANHLEVFAVGDDGALWHAWQIDQPPNWSPWHSLERPTAGIRAADHLTVANNQDGRLEVFVGAPDGTVWHVWQTR